MKQSNNPELLSPAGDWPSLMAAIDAGADSVYFGIKGLNMRAGAKNFDLKELKKVVDTAHKSDVKAYLALNTILYEKELGKARKTLEKAKEAGIDAVIAWDMAVINEAKKLKIPVHLSTQASVSNSSAADFYMKAGARRIIFARECSLKDLKEIRKNAPGAEMEVFVHGAMCISVSGRCFLSHEIFGKSANRGECLQPCRREYIVEEKEEKHALKVGSSCILSPKDLCALPFIDRLRFVDCFKIEGRNRSPEYVKTVTEVYREAIDAGRADAPMIRRLMKKLGTVYNRGFSPGFFTGMPTAKDFTDSCGSRAAKRKVYVGYVENYYSKAGAAQVRIEAGNIKEGDTLLFIGSKTGVVEQSAASMEIEGRKIMKAGKGTSIGIKTDKKVRENDKVYVLSKSTGLSPFANIEYPLMILSIKKF